MPTTTTRSILRTATALVVATGLTLVACSDDDDDGNTAATAAATDPAGGTADDTAAPGDGAAAAGDGAVITIASFAFSGVTDVPVGTTVTVVNDDGVAHTWTAADGSFDGGTIAPGESFEYTFDTAGDFAYFCQFHSQMGGSITVTA